MRIEIDAPDVIVPFGFGPTPTINVCRGCGALCEEPGHTLLDCLRALQERISVLERGLRNIAREEFRDDDPA